MQRWLAALPAGLARSRPRLLLPRAILALLSDRVGAAEGLLDAAERTPIRVVMLPPGLVVVWRVELYR